LHGTAQRGYLSTMFCSLGHRGALRAGALALFAALLAMPAPAAVTLQASSTTVANPGDSGTICVTLLTGGQEVAGTQNDLVWDGSCASLPDTSSCYAAGNHGKSLQGKLLDNRDFTYRALILSLGDVDPIDSGVLYCCNFVAEAAAGQCCTISMTGMGASDSKGNAVSALGGPGKLCVAKGSGSGGGGGGGFGAGQPLGASNEVPGGEAAPAAPANAAPSGGGAAAPPPAQVMQGGGARAGEPIADAPATIAAPAAAAGTVAPTPPAAAPARVAAPALVPATLAPALPPATAAATAASNTAAPTPPATKPDTPTAAARASTPTHRAAGTPTAAAAKAAAEKSDSWFGCQVGGGAAPWPGAVVAALLAIAARRARRRPL
jgi:MYXO-CTERM domain-containing protein